MKKKLRNVLALVLTMTVLLAVPLFAFAEEGTDSGKGLVIEVVEDDDEVTIEDAETPLAADPCSGAAETQSGSMYLVILAVLIAVFAAGTLSVRAEQRKVDSLAAELKSIRSSEAGRR